jgi:heme-degrading monooxygenase HmoA
MVLSMIARSWSARATVEGAAAYVTFYRETMVRQLERIEGHRGSLVLTRAGDDGEAEITVLTFWESMEAVSRFAGTAFERAVVEAAAQEALTSFDEWVEHRHVEVDTMRPREG